MEKHLLQKEEEFHKLNAELELKTKELLKEVEGVMKIQDTLSKSKTSKFTGLRNPANSSSNTLSEVYTVTLNESRQWSDISSQESSSTSQNQPGKCGKHGSARSVRTELPHLNMQEDSVNSVWAPVHGGICDEILPEASYGMGTEGISRFLRAKVKGLQNEMELLQDAYKKKTEAVHKAEAAMKCLEEERNKWQQQARMLRDSLKKQEMLASSTAAKLTQQESENISLKKELEAVKKELRTVVQTLKTNEMRLNRSLEELEKLRTIMHNHERDDKELRDLTRKKEDEVAVVVKRLEKHKSELLLAFKKQMQLIDNLKKQKAHLQAAHMMQFSEEEFLKLLDWSPSDKQQSEHQKAFDVSQ